MIKKLMIPLVAATLLLAGCGDKSEPAPEKAAETSVGQSESSEEESLTGELLKKGLEKGAEWLEKRKEKDEAGSTEPSEAEQSEDGAEQPTPTSEQADSSDPAALVSNASSDGSGEPPADGGAASQQGESSTGFSIPGKGWHWSLWVILTVLVIILVIVLTHSDEEPHPYKAGGLVLLFVAWVCYSNDLLSGDSFALNAGILAGGLIVYLLFGYPRAKGAFSGIANRWDRAFKKAAVQFIEQNELRGPGGGLAEKIPAAHRAEFQERFWPSYARQHGFAVEVPEMRAYRKVLVTRGLFWIFDVIDGIFRRFLRDLMEWFVDRLKRFCEQDTRKIQGRLDALFSADEAATT